MGIGASINQLRNDADTVTDLLDTSFQDIRYSNVWPICRTLCFLSP
jgi:hypothetical protein